MRSTLFCAAAAVLIALPAEAQRPESGDYSVAIALFNSSTGTQFSAGRMFGGRIHGAVEITYRSGSIEDVSSNVAVGIPAVVDSGEWLIGPTVRFYGTQSGPVVPYLRAKLGYGGEADDLTIGASNLRDENIDILEGSLSIGAEWFPVKGVGFSGHTGVQWRREAMERFDEQRNKLERTTTSMGTFRSSLTLSLYFQ